MVYLLYKKQLPMLVHTATSYELKGELMLIIQ